MITFALDAAESNIQGLIGLDWLVRVKIDYCMYERNGCSAPALEDPGIH